MKREIHRCRSCGELLYDGDTAYRIRGEVHCPACVTGAMFVCRRKEPSGRTHAVFTPLSPEDEAACGMKARRITWK